MNKFSKLYLFLFIICNNSKFIIGKTNKTENEEEKNMIKSQTLLANKISLNPKKNFSENKENSNKNNKFLNFQ